MPTYEYQCKTCHTTFERFQSIKARPLRSHHCASCGRTRPVQRLIGTGAALLFRGGGFYQTDYRSESYRKAAEAESKPAAQKESSNGAAASGGPAEPKATAAAKPPAGKKSKSTAASSPASD